MKNKIQDFCSQVKVQPRLNFNMSFNFLMDLILKLYLYSSKKSCVCIYIHVYILISHSWLTKCMWPNGLDFWICLFVFWELWGQVSKIMFIKSLNFTSLLTLNIVKQSLYLFDNGHC